MNKKRSNREEDWKLIDRIHKRWMEHLIKRTYGDQDMAAEILGVSLRTWRNWKKRLRPRMPSRKKHRMWQREAEQRIQREREIALRLEAEAACASG